MIVNTQYMKRGEPRAWLTFSSPASFTLAISDGAKHWNGVLEYSTDGRIWTEWSGATTLTAAQTPNGSYQLLLCGTGNTRISYITAWVLTGSNIRCDGNIETLLDYKTVVEGKHPTMESSCFAKMFDGNTSLISAPTLPAMTLAQNCYGGMFSGCTALTDAPALPATTLATTCYDDMFMGCTSLLAAPALPALTMQLSCYENMFGGCTSLVRPPVLPATTLARMCYHSMFEGCTNLSCIPILPATVLRTSCYSDMFSGCSKLKIRSGASGKYQHAYRIPPVGTGEMYGSDYSPTSRMFGEQSSPFVGTPQPNTTYYVESEPI